MALTADVPVDPTWGGLPNTRLMHRHVALFAAACCRPYFGVFSFQFVQCWRAAVAVVCSR